MFCKNYKILNRFGFTLIELMIVMAIFITVTLITFPLYSNWQATTRLDYITQEIEESLRIAQTKSRAGYNDSAHGVYFDADNRQFVYYQGPAYQTRNGTYDLVQDIDADIEVSTVWPDADVNFSEYTGSSSVSGLISLVNRSGVERQISINNYSYISSE